MDAQQRKRAFIAVGALTIAVVAGVAWAQLTSAVAERVRAESSARGVELEFDDVDVWPNGLVRLHDVTLGRGGYRAQVDTLSIDAGVFASGTLSGRPPIESVELEGAQIKATRRNGSSTAATSSDADPAPDPFTTLQKLGGNTVPRIVVADLEVDVPQGAARVGRVEVDADAVTLYMATLQGELIDRVVTQPLSVERLRVTPAAAVLRRDRAAVKRVEIAGASVQTELRRLRGLSASGDASTTADGRDSGWNARLHALLNRVFSVGAAANERMRTIAPPTVQLSRSTITLTDVDVRATGVEATWSREAATIKASAADVVHEARAVGQVEMRFEATVPRLTVAVERFDLSLARLLHDRVPLSGRGDAKLEIEAIEETFALRGHVAAREVVIATKRLADDPVVFENLTYDFDAVYAPVSDSLGEPKLIGHPTGGVRFTKAERRGSFEITRGELTMPGLSAQVRLALYGLGSLPVWPARLDVSVVLPRTPAQAVLDAIGAPLLGAIQGARLGGEVEATVNVELPLQRASRMRWKIAEQLHDFEIVHLPEAVDVRRLLGPMTATIGSGDPCRLTIEIPAMRSEKNPRGVVSDVPPTEVDGCVRWKYAPLDIIADTVHRGILTTEDGAFYRHTGFNEDAIRKSLERNIEEGRFARGASTISMQFVKNLFLSKGKQASRKLREVILVYLMERVVEVPKKRVMEIYFNIIEYGVGVYGIWAAAQHYFGKKPSELEVVEVAWIITLIPGPRSRYPYFERRTIPDEWWERMQNFLDEMYRKERLDEFELLTAKAQPPKFRDGSAPAENDPSRFRAQVAPLARRMQALREAGRSREAILAWSKTAAP